MLFPVFTPLFQDCVFQAAYITAEILKLIGEIKSCHGSQQAATQTLSRRVKAGIGWTRPVQMFGAYAGTPENIFIIKVISMQKPTNN